MGKRALASGDLQKKKKEAIASFFIVLLFSTLEPQGLAIEVSTCLASLLIFSKVCVNHFVRTG